MTQLQHGEWLEAQDHVEEAQPLVDEARETFERLQATPGPERAVRAERAGAAQTA